MHSRLSSYPDGTSSLVSTVSTLIAAIEASFESVCRVSNRINPSFFHLGHRFSILPQISYGDLVREGKGERRKVEIESGNKLTHVLITSNYLSGLCLRYTSLIIFENLLLGNNLFIAHYCEISQGWRYLPRLSFFVVIMCHAFRSGLIFESHPPPWSKKPGHLPVKRI